MKKPFRVVFLLALIVIVVSACGSSDKKSSTYTTLSPNDAYDKLSKNSDAVIVDVRNPDEWQTTGVPVGAVLISLPQFDQQAPAALSKDKDIYVICNSGNRSRVASESLIKMGYSHVYNVDGGMQAWLRANLPTEPYTP